MELQDRGSECVQEGHKSLLGADLDTVIILCRYIINNDLLDCYSSRGGTFSNFTTPHP